MFTPKASGVSRVTVSLDPVDLDLLDRLAALEGLNRSAELRSILSQLRPMLLATVEAFEAALAQKELFDQKIAETAMQDIQSLLPELESLQRSYLGAMSRIEGAEAADPRRSNHGGHTPTPPHEESTS